jgi:hypothetical protein
LNPHENLVLLSRGEHAINRRVLHLLFGQLRKLDSGYLQKWRASVAENEWVLPDRGFFNPVLMIPDLDDVRELGRDYPVASLAVNGETTWLFNANQCLTKVFQHYLPAWTQMPPTFVRAADAELQERRDQGQLRGFLETEILLSGFVPKDEYRHGRSSWLDEPDNLRLFLESSEPSNASHVGEPSGWRGYWANPQWQNFQRAVSGELYRCLDVYGLTPRVCLLYWLLAIRTPVGRSMPLLPVLDYVEGRVSRRRAIHRLEGLRLGFESAALHRILDRAGAEVRGISTQERSRCFNRFLVDFLVLRRDLKLAYKAYEAMDGIRLIEEPGEVRLSRSNASLIEFECCGDAEPLPRRIRSHAVIKADVRGSTLITERLCAQGLNPASHFSLNFFDPVNKLLPEYGAEKVFVEGDAVILAIFEYEGENSVPVARACGLARKILQVVTLQNVLNRKHGLPELEIGLGIAFSPQEPNFLYDGARRVMISSAINRADRLSACASALRASGFSPQQVGFRVAVVRDMRIPDHPIGDDELLNYNINGVNIEREAFFRLKRELPLDQVRLAGEEGSDGLFLVGNYTDLVGHRHWLVVRYGPVREWHGDRLGAVDAERRHFFEVVVDEALSARVRKLAQSPPG